MTPSSTGRIFFVGLALLLLAGAGLLTVSLAPTEAVQQSIILVDHDNSTTPLRPYLARILQWLSLGASLIVFSLAGVAYAKRDRLYDVLLIFAGDLRDYRREVVAEVRELLAPGARWKLGTLGLFLVLGVALRIAALDAPMRYDESYTFNYHGLRDILNIVSDYTTPNNHIFQSVLVHFSYQLFGASPAALRLPALLAGVLLIPASFWLLRRLFDEARFEDAASLIAAGLVSLSMPLIGYSANARGYTWLTLLFLLGFTLATRLREKRNLAVWTLFAVVFVLGFFTIPVMLYGYAIVAMWLLLSVSSGRRKALFVELLVTSAVVASVSVFLYTPAAVRCTLENIVANPFVRPLSFSIWATYFPQLPGGLADYVTRGLPMLVRGLLLLGLAASVLLPGNRGRGTRRLHFAILLTLPPLMAAQQVVPYLRVLLFVAPVYFGLAVVGLAGLIDWLPRSGGLRWRRWIFVTAVVGLVAGGTITLSTRQPPRGLFADLPEALEQLRPLLSQGVPILAGIPLSEPLLYHAERLGLPRRSVIESFNGKLRDRDYLPYWGAKKLGNHAMIYFIEEKASPKRQFVSFEVRPLKVSHSAFVEFFEPPEQVGETESTTSYRLRLKKDKP